MEEKEHFYHELDTKGRRSFCTCQSLAFAFVLLAIVASGGIIWAAKQVLTAVKPTRQIAVTRQDGVDLQQKVNDLAKAPGASSALTLTEKELTSLLVTAISNDPNAPLRGVQSTIDPDQVTITGTAPKYFNASLTIGVVPKVVVSRPKLELVKIQAGSLNVPAALTQVISNYLEDVLDKQMTQLNGTTIKSVRLQQGSMIITGTILPTPPPIQN